MCLGIPGRVLDIRDGTATVDVAGARKEASLMLLDNVVAGDYVIVHAGFAIERVDEEEAQKTLALVDELVAGMERLK